MNNSYDYPEVVGIIVGLGLFAVLILWALSGSYSDSSDHEPETYCDPKTGCY